MTSFTASRGYAIHCHADDCTATTADQAPSRHTRTLAAALDAAATLGWMPARTRDGQAVWICPLHQTWDATAGRWTPTRRQTCHQEGTGARLSDREPKSARP